MITFNREVDVSEFYPKVVSESSEFKKIAIAENPEFKLLWDVWEEVFNNQFIEDATEYGIAQWEKMLELAPFDGDSIDDRRSAVIVTLAGQLPFTYRKLEEILNNLCGEGGYTIDLNGKAFTIRVSVSLGSKRLMDQVETMLEEVIPKNLIITVELLYNRHKDLKKFTHEVMKKWNHHDLREEVLNG